MNGPEARVGLLYFGSRRAALDSGRYEALLQGLRELGWREGKGLAIEARFADGSTERLGPQTAGLLRARPDVIVATGAPAYRALRRATSTVPIVVTAAADPVAEGLATSLARPGANFTGLTDTAAFLGPRHLELLDAIVPQLASVAVLADPDGGALAAQLARIAAAAQAIGRRTLPVEARGSAEIEAGFAAVSRKTEAMIVLGDTLFVDQLRHIAELSLRFLLPSAHSLPAFAEVGGLLGYGHELRESFRRAAFYVDRILKGARPGELPFEQPTRHRLAVNLKTAGSLGLTIPRSLLSRADRVIE